MSYKPTLREIILQPVPNGTKMELKFKSIFRTVNKIDIKLKNKTVLVPYLDTAPIYLWSHKHVTVLYLGMSPFCLQMKCGCILGMYIN